MRTYYELLGIEPAADADTIKKAFRREIARYHPDKVQHLGLEFQEMAATRAAELTAAYKVLSDAGSRAEYDESAGVGRNAPASSPPAKPPPEAAESSSEASGAGAEPQPAYEPQPPGGRFAQERAGRDDIMRRATLARVRLALKQVLGECHTPEVKGFDLACLPKSKPVTSLTISQLFQKKTMPAVLVRLAPLVDGALATETWGLAMRVRLDKKNQPIAVLLIGNHLAPASELAKAIDDARRKSPASQDLIFPVPIDLRDWTAKIPLNAPEVVRTLVERLKSSG